MPSRFSRLKSAPHQWGGGTSAFFAYMHFSFDMPMGLLSPLLPLIKADLGLNYLQAGLLLSARSITTGISQLPGGWLSDRYSKRLVISIGMAGVGLATMAIGLSSGYYPLLVILIVGGLFAGTYHPSAASWLSNYFEKERRGRAMSLHLLGGSLAFMLGPILAGYISSKLGWHSAYFILAIPTLVAVIFILTLFKRIVPSISMQQSSEDSVAVKQASKVSRFGSVLKSVAFITSLAVLTQFLAGSVMGFFTVYLVDIHHIEMASAAMWMSVVRAGAVIGSPVGGWLSDKWGRRNALYLVLIATGPIVYLLSSLSFGATLIVVFIVFGFLMHMRQATIQPLLMDSSPSDLRGTVFGLYFGLSMEGQSLIQPIVGQFMDIHGIDSIFNTIALISVVLSIISLLLFLKAKLWGYNVQKTMRT